MSIHYGASGLHGGMVGGNTSPLPAGQGLGSWPEQTRNHEQTWDAVEAYFECITTCSLEDGECITRCVEQLRET